MFSRIQFVVLADVVQFCAALLFSHKATAAPQQIKRLSTLLGPSLADLDTSPGKWWLLQRSVTVRMQRM